MGDEILARVIRVAAEVRGQSLDSLSAQTAVSQDLHLAGSEVEDFVRALAEQFGDQVWAWPWRKFVILDEGPGCFFFLPSLIWQLLTWPARGSFGYPDGLEMLTLGHIAAVIKKGEWFSP